ncbi:MAG: hypothetical protein J6W10_10535 [Kiritimatiellae bacterium]|nr:hypothetical protein [Kiritimatiellia bacterium]
MAKRKRVNEKTPNGGDYSEIAFYDNKMTPVDEKDATYCVISEYKKDGTLISNTYGSMERK